MGSGTLPDEPYATHALRWSGTANSVLDLHDLLPAEFLEGNSIAYDIGIDGSIAGLAQRPDGSTVGVLWRKLPTAPTNLMAKAGFELDANNDSRPDTWTTSSRFARSNAVVFRGSYAGKLSATDNSGVIIRQSVQNLTAGARYIFSGRVNIPDSNDPFTLKLQVVWRAGNTVLRTSTVKTYTSSTSGWSPATASLIAPAGTTNGLVRIVVSSLNRTIYVDQLVLKKR